MTRRVVAALLLVGCGGAETPPAPAAPAHSLAPVVETAAAPTPAAGLPELPWQLAMRAPLPAEGTAERALLERWAAAVGFDLANEPTFFFHATRTDLGVLGPTSILELSGHDDGTPRGDGGTLFVIERGGVAGPALRVAIAGASIVGEATPGPWLLSIAACPDDAAPSLDDEGRPVIPPACEDLRPSAGAALLARAGATSPADVVPQALGELLRLGDPAASIDVIEEPSALPPEARRRFRPLTAALAEGTLSAELTVRLGGTCVPLIRYALLALRATGTTLTVDVTPIGSETLTARCL